MARGHEQFDKENFEMHRRVLGWWTELRGWRSPEEKPLQGGVRLLKARENHGLSPMCMGCVCMACVHMRVFGENQTGDSLQREQYVQRPRRVGSLALERSSPSPA